MERAYGSFQRVIPLPKSVVEEKAEATYQNGVLTVRLPKRVPERSRSIPVS
jgi:HSP20 family protein